MKLKGFRASALGHRLPREDARLNHEFSYRVQNKIQTAPLKMPPRSY